MQMVVWFNYSSALGSHAGGIGTHSRGLGRALSDLVETQLISNCASTEPEAAVVRVLRPGLPRPIWRSAVLPIHLALSAPTAYVDTAFHAPLTLPMTAVITFVQDATPFNKWAPRAASKFSLQNQIRGAFRRGAVVFTSQSVKQEYVDLGKCEDEHRVIPLGVSKAHVEAPQRPAGGYFVYIGSKYPRKNAKLCHNACARAGVKLIALGSAHGSELGEQQLIELVAGASAVLVPSYYEGFSLPIIEARALGVPVICSDIPIHREVALPATTKFIDPDDENAWVKEIERADRVHLPRQKSWYRTWRDVALDVLELI